MASRLTLALAMLGSVVVSVEPAQSQENRQSISHLNLPPEVLRMSPASGMAKVRPVKPPRRAGSKLAGLVKSGKVVIARNTNPIVLTPRHPYHESSGSWLSCEGCSIWSGGLPNIVVIDPFAELRGKDGFVVFRFDNLHPLATYVVELEGGHSGLVNLEQLQLNVGNLSVVQTLSVTTDPVLVAFKAPSSGSIAFDVQGQNDLSYFWLYSVNLTEVNQ